MRKSPEIVDKVRKILNKKNNEFKTSSCDENEFTIYLNKFNIERTGELEPAEAMELVYDCASREDVLVCWDDEWTTSDLDDQEFMAFYIVPTSLVDQMVTLNDLP